jgi:thiol-disulfide isomerase/thioredoxin
MFQQYICIILLLSLVLLINHITIAVEYNEDFPSTLVANVDASNIAKFMSSNEPILLEFMAPWCSHCKSFEGRYKQVAARLPEYRVGASDATENPSLTARFHIDSIPVLYLYKNSELYKYKGNMNPDDIISWVSNGHLNDKPFPIWSSPMGPMGLTKGYLVSLAMYVINLFPYITKTLNLPGIYLCI